MMRLRTLIPFLLAAAAAALPASARDFRVNQVPNGAVASCNTCHLNGGGTPRNPFGLAVFAITGSANRPFWSPALAEKDSDGDGFTNGQELGDPDGDGVPTPGAIVTNPGNRNSKPPANEPPVFTSTPVTDAVIGLAYAYAAAASDPESQSLAFSKVAGPPWLTVATDGSVSGTAPEGAAGVFPVTLRVTDSGSPANSAEQTYQLSVTSSLAGWQAIHFSLPAEAALAEPLADPDIDGLPNVAEYALRLNPRSADAVSATLPRFEANGDITLAVAVRDDDPRLEVAMEGALEASYQDAQAASVQSSDPVPGDGLKTLQFRDVVQVPQLGERRFWRLNLRLNP